MRVLYAYEWDAGNPAIQSTRPFSILQELRKRFEVVPFFPISNISKYFLAPRKLLHSALGRQHHLEREWLCLKEMALRTHYKFNSAKADIIFSPSQLIPTYLKVDVPIIYCTDAPFGPMVEYYPGFSKISDAYRRSAFIQEENAHKNATKIVYPSAWARDAAISMHKASPDKCIEQPFGANLPYHVEWADIKFRNRSRGDEIKIVMICSNWLRKGGDYAFSVVQELRRRGKNALLKVIGKTPVPNSDSIETLGYIDKWTESGGNKFRATMFNADFMIMPSVAEAYGMSLWEGAAHGLPMIGRATGGIPSIIRHNENGMLFPFDCAPTLVADWIESACEESNYRRLREAAYADYISRGNWRVFVDRVFS
jgi:glycosyltransferase involved in cell wall biosynthesis